MDDQGRTALAETVDIGVAAATMIDAIASVRYTDALMLLVALAALVPSPLAGRALAAATPILEDKKVRAPKWPAHVGRVDPTGAWQISYTLGDRDNLLLGFRQADGVEHSIVVYLVHNLVDLCDLAREVGLEVRPIDGPEGRPATASTPAFGIMLQPSTSHQRSGASAS